jgi:AsmA protein
MRAVRLIAFGIGALFALLVLVILAIGLLVKPNDYKDRIIHGVKSATGRDLALPGTIKLSVFPWVALELGPASLGNPSGFQGGEFMSVEHVALRVRLLPLLHKQLQIGRIEIEQLHLDLHKNAAGKGNWEDFGAHPATTTTTTTTPSGAQTGSMFQSLAGVSLGNSSITYNGITITDLNLAIGKVTGQYNLSDVNLTGKLSSGGGAPALPFALTLPAASLDLRSQTLQVPQFTGRVAAANVSGSLKGDRILDQPAISGDLALEPLDLRSLAAQLGINLPRTRDAQAFSRLGAKLAFGYAGKALRLQNVQAQLDDSRLEGSVAVTDLDTKAAVFALTLDHIDLDRYRAPAQSAPAMTPPGSATAPADSRPGALKTLDLRGSFAIARASFSGLTLSDLNLRLQARDGLIQLAPLTAKMYGGAYSATITYDVRGATPQVQLNQQLVGIDMSPLLKDGLRSERLSGRGNASTALTARGLGSDALMNSLNGRIDLSVANGAVEGADLWYEIGMAQALLKRQPLSGAVNTHHTKFDEMHMSATVVDGVTKTNDLLLATPYLRVSGQGSANLVSTAIDLHLTATVLKAPPNAQSTDLAQLTLAAIPVTVSGTANDPKVRPDLQGLLKSQLQEKAKDLLKDKLKGFFGTH